MTILKVVTFIIRSDERKHAFEMKKMEFRHNERMQVLKIFIFWFSQSNFFHYRPSTLSLRRRGGEERRKGREERKREEERRGRSNPKLGMVQTIFLQFSS